MHDSPVSKKDPETIWREVNLLQEEASLNRNQLVNIPVMDMDGAHGKGHGKYGAVELT